MFDLWFYWAILPLITVLSLLLAITMMVWGIAFIGAIVALYSTFSGIVKRLMV